MKNFRLTGLTWIVFALLVAIAVFTFLLALQSTPGENSPLYYPYTLLYDYYLLVDAKVITVASDYIELCVSRLEFQGGLCSPNLVGIGVIAAFFVMPLFLFSLLISTLWNGIGELSRPAKKTKLQRQREQYHYENKQNSISRFKHWK